MPSGCAVPGGNVANRVASRRFHADAGSANDANSATQSMTAKRVNFIRPPFQLSVGSCQLTVTTYEMEAVTPPRRNRCQLIHPLRQLSTVTRQPSSTLFLQLASLASILSTDNCQRTTDCGQFLANTSATAGCDSIRESISEKAGR